MKKSLSISLFTASLIALTACFPFLTSGSWRYRMTVEVETPEGIKTGSAVREVSVTESPNLTPEMNASVKVKGEAVVVDLGERGVLFALLRGEASSGHAHDVVYRTFPFSDGAHTSDGIRYYRSLKDVKGNVPENDLPLMVRFSNLRDPITVSKVDAQNLAASFGNGVRLKQITIEITDDGVTEGIIKWLPWLPQYRGKRLNGNRFGTIKTKFPFANSLSAGAFAAGTLKGQNNER